MKKTLLAALAAVSLSSTAFAGPSVLVVGIDVSQSNPLLLAGAQFDQYRLNSKQRVRDAVNQLEAGSVLMIRTFGDNLATPRALGVADVTIIPLGRHAPDPRLRTLESYRAAVADEAARKVDQAIALAQAHADPYTRITRFLEALSAPVSALAVFQNPVAGPQPRDVRFLLLTDGVEDDPPNRLARGANLPAASAARYQRCTELKMVGFAQAATTMTRAAETHMRDEWTRWAATLGCPFVPDAGL